MIPLCVSQLAAPRYRSEPQAIMVGPVLINHWWVAVSQKFNVKLWATQLPPVDSEMSPTNSDATVRAIQLRPHLDHTTDIGRGLVLG
jgi:hypothetical protein